MSVQAVLSGGGYPALSYNPRNRTIAPNHQPVYNPLQIADQLSEALVIGDSGWTTVENSDVALLQQVPFFSMSAYKRVFDKYIEESAKFEPYEGSFSGTTIPFLRASSAPPINILTLEKQINIDEVIHSEPVFIGEFFGIKPTGKMLDFRTISSDAVNPGISQICFAYNNKELSDIRLFAEETLIDLAADFFDIPLGALIGALFTSELSPETEDILTIVPIRGPNISVKFFSTGVGIRDFSTVQDSIAGRLIDYFLHGYDPIGLFEEVAAHEFNIIENDLADFSDHFKARVTANSTITLGNAFTIRNAKYGGVFDI